MMNESLLVVHKLLDAAVLRHGVLANNVANLHTPGYIRKDVQFRDALAKAVAGGSRSAIEAVKPAVVQDEKSPRRPDGNNVTLQRELGEMAENELLYQLLMRSASGKFAGLRKAIRGQ